MPCIAGSPSIFDCDADQNEVNIPTVVVRCYLNDSDSCSEYRRQHVEVGIDAQGEEESTKPHYVTIYACVVLWMFNVLFGLIAYVLSGKFIMASVIYSFLRTGA